jgi:hypothetical protein
MDEKEQKLREEGKKKFEVRTIWDENGFQERAVFVDGEYFDWGIDEEAFDWAVKQGPEYLRIIKMDIAKHFLESLSEMVGRKVTMIDFEQARKTGWI